MIGEDLWNGFLNQFRLVESAESFWARDMVISFIRGSWLQPVKPIHGSRFVAMQILMLTAEIKKKIGDNNQKKTGSLAVSVETRRNWLVRDLHCWPL